MLLQKAGVGGKAIAFCYKWAIQVIRNADRGAWRVSNFPEKSVTKVYGSTLLALRGVGWGSNFQETSVT